jgi:hypothetical protein
MVTVEKIYSVLESAKDSVEFDYLFFGYNFRTHNIISVLRLAYQKENLFLFDKLYYHKIGDYVNLFYYLGTCEKSEEYQIKALKIILKYDYNILLKHLCYQYEQYRYNYGYNPKINNSRIYLILKALQEIDKLQYFKNLLQKIIKNAPYNCENYLTYYPDWMVIYLCEIYKEIENVESAKNVEKVESVGSIGSVKRIKVSEESFC